ncbi:MAG: hypothetical protein EXR00_05715 [Alphaproteobacteria bacterium]|nr:hypothetical protein [Alphaproteobacteria bacterium]
MSTGAAISTRRTRIRAPPGRESTYVDSGETNVSAEGTALHLFDPNPARANLFLPALSNSGVLIKPEPGLMILFPSYVPHSVPPHQGDGARISIAFNVRKEPFP